MKPKYRVIKRDGPYPFKVEKKTFIFWSQVDQESSFENAKETMMRRCKEDSRVAYGTVLATYSLEDLTADKLRGEQ